MTKKLLSSLSTSSYFRRFRRRRFFNSMSSFFQFLRHFFHHFRRRCFLSLSMSSLFRLLRCCSFVWKRHPFLSRFFIVPRLGTQGRPAQALVSCPELQTSAPIFSTFVSISKLLSRQFSNLPRQLSNLPRHFSDCLVYSRPVTIRMAPPVSFSPFPPGW